MAVGNYNLQWLNHNSVRAYPLTERASKLDLTGLIRIPDSFIVGLRFPVHAGLDIRPDKFFLRSLLIAATGYNIALAYDDGSTTPPLVAAVNIAKSTHTENLTYAMPGAGDFLDSVGQITIGKLDEIDQLPPGNYRFSAAAGELEPDAIPPLIRGITSITLVNGTDRSEPLYGHIELTAGTNIRLTPEVSEGVDPKIVISAISGEGLTEDCVCAETELGPCIRTINGIAPSLDGNFRLTGDSCLLIAPITNGLALTDDCSKPCCGCDKLDRLNQQLELFGNGYTTLQGLANRTAAEVTQMSMVVLGSRIGDQGCLS